MYVNENRLIECFVSQSLKFSVSDTLPLLQFDFSHLRIAQIVTYFAQTEQDMNAVERVTVYAELPSEGDATTPNDPPASWPSNGAITFSGVALAYREGLPLVLKDVNFDIKAGEKVSLCTCSYSRVFMSFQVGIVGRTGAGNDYSGFSHPV